MAKTRKYNQRKSTRGKTPKKKNKMRQKGGETYSSCNNVKNGKTCLRSIRVGDKIIPYNGKCRNGECHIQVKSFKEYLHKTLNSMSSNTVKTKMTPPTPRIKYVTPSGSYYSRRKTWPEMFGVSN